jgi:hypothetical protein
MRFSLAHSRPSHNSWTSTFFHQTGRFGCACFLMTASPLSGGGNMRTAETIELGQRNNLTSHHRCHPHLGWDKVETSSVPPPPSSSGTVRHPVHPQTRAHRWVLWLECEVACGVRLDRPDIPLVGTGARTSPRTTEHGPWLLPLSRIVALRTPSAVSLAFFTYSS